MLSIEEISNRLKDRNKVKVAEAVGLSYPVVIDMSKGVAGNYDSVKRMSDYLESNP
jgi:alkyl hydroperoxide reductase subunit AhpC